MQHQPFHIVYFYLKKTPAPAAFFVHCISRMSQQWPLFICTAGCTLLPTCPQGANAAFYPLIGSGSLKPPLPLTALQRYSGSPSRHVWRQMESESVSGLSEMSFTSAAHKESGHRRSGGLHSGKKEVCKNLSSTLTSLTQGWKRGEQQGRKTRETGQVAKRMNERNRAGKVRWELQQIVRRVFVQLKE